MNFVGAALPFAKITGYVLAFATCGKFNAVKNAHLLKDRWLQVVHRSPGTRIVAPFVRTGVRTEPEALYPRRGWDSQTALTGMEWSPWAPGRFPVVAEPYA